MTNLTKLLWPQTEDGNFLEVAQKRCIIVFCTLAAIAGVGASLASLPEAYPKYPVFSLVEVVGSPLYLAGPVLIYLGYDFRRVATAMLVFAYLFIAGPALTVGGLISDDAIFLVPWVLVTALALGWKAGIWATVITIASYAGIFFLRHEIYPTPVSLTVDGLSEWLLEALGFTAVVTGIAVAIFLQQMQRMTENLQAARKAAESADRAKSEFLANMSHEIRTPMNGVMGMAEVLASTKLDHSQKVMTDIIVKSGSALLTIINDILDFSKISAGKMELDPAPFELVEAVEDVVTLLSAKAYQKDIELCACVDPSLPEFVVGDVGRVRQILTNLTGNAIKFTETGSIRVSVSGAVATSLGLDVAKLRFEVRDTGIGIPPDKLNAVFGQFSQVDNSASRKHEGTGLGLAISSSLVKLMGGNIGVESAQGEGSTFWFEVALPVCDREISKVADLEFSKIRILCLDGLEESRSQIQDHLNRLGSDLAVAATGREALAILRVASERCIPVDCVIFENNIADMDSVDFVTAVRADKRIGNTPLIMLSSPDQPDRGIPLSPYDVDVRMVKPVRSSILRETISRVMSERRVTDEDYVTEQHEDVVARLGLLTDRKSILHR